VPLNPKLAPGKAPISNRQPVPGAIPANRIPAVPIKPGTVKPGAAKSSGSGAERIKQRLSETKDVKALAIINSAFDSQTDAERKKAISMLNAMGRKGEATLLSKYFNFEEAAAANTTGEKAALNTEDDTDASKPLTEEEKVKQRLLGTKDKRAKAIIDRAFSSRNDAEYLKAIADLRVINKTAEADMLRNYLDLKNGKGGPKKTSPAKSASAIRH
jgi:hypothetical protein